MNIGVIGVVVILVVLGVILAFYFGMGAPANVCDVSLKSYDDSTANCHLNDNRSSISDEDTCKENAGCLCGTPNCNYYCMNNNDEPTYECSENKCCGGGIIQKFNPDMQYKTLRNINDNKHQVTCCNGSMCPTGASTNPYKEDYGGYCCLKDGECVFGDGSENYADDSGATCVMFFRTSESSTGCTACSAKSAKNGVQDGSAGTPPRCDAGMNITSPDLCKLSATRFNDKKWEGALDSNELPSGCYVTSGGNIKWNACGQSATTYCPDGSIPNAGEYACAGGSRGGSTDCTPGDDKCPDSTCELQETVGCATLSCKINDTGMVLLNAVCSSSGDGCHNGNGTCTYDAFDVTCGGACIPSEGSTYTQCIKDNAVLWCPFKRDEYQDAKGCLCMGDRDPKDIPFGPSPMQLFNCPSCQNNKAWIYGGLCNKDSDCPNGECCVEQNTGKLECDFCVG